MHFIVLDLEATCGDGVETSEIIEIGAVKINERMEIVSEFQSFVRPVIHPTITYFCEELTTIKQADVDSARTFPEVCVDFARWCGVSSTNREDLPFWLCSWGFYDKKMLLQDCAKWDLQTIWLSNHISIKHQHGEMLYKEEEVRLKSLGMIPTSRTKQLQRGIGMDKALKKLNIPLEGTHHRAISDAQNIAKIFIEIFPNLKF